MDELSLCEIRDELIEIVTKRLSKYIEDNKLKPITVRDFDTYCSFIIENKPNEHYEIKIYSIPLATAPANKILHFDYIYGFNTNMFHSDNELNNILKEINNKTIIRRFMFKKRKEELDDIVEIVYNKSRRI